MQGRFRGFIEMNQNKDSGFVSVCPRCYSTSITLTDRPALTAYKELYSRRRRCGLEAKTFPEIALTELKKPKKKIIKQKKR